MEFMEDFFNGVGVHAQCVFGPLIADRDKAWPFEPAL